MALSMESEQALLQLTRICDKHMVCESEANIHTLMRLLERWILR